MPPLGSGLAAALPFTLMHSGFLLLLWFVGVASVQFLPSAGLGLVVAACLLLALGLSRARVVRLLRRVRVLAVAIVVLFGWFTRARRCSLSGPVCHRRARASRWRWSMSDAWS